MYVYCLKSITDPNREYIGVTKDLETRLIAHNRGQCSHTKKYWPWKLNCYHWFDDENKARAFERYLKHGSGHAFAKRHFW